MKSKNNSVLLKICLRNESAFEELVNKYSRVVKKIAFSLLGDVHFAEDIAQEVFLRIYEKKDRLSKIKNPKSYVYSIARNLTRDYSRWLNGMPGQRRYSIKMDSLDQIEEKIENILYHNSVPDYLVKNAEKEELNQIVLREINNLPKRWSEFIKLKYFKGMGEGEVSRLMNVPKSTFTNSISKSRTALKSRLIKYVA